MKKKDITTSLKRWMVKREMEIESDKWEILSHSLEDTQKLAKNLAEYLTPGCLLTLEGDLGAGKTSFTQGLARGLGVKGIVNSPTFTLIKEYEGNQFPFYHMDVYRISLEEADELGLEEYFFGEGVTVVEWASRIDPLLPGERLDLTLRVTGETERMLTLRPRGEKYKALVQRWAEEFNE